MASNGFAQRLDLLFRVATQPDGTRWTYSAVSAAAAEQGISISRTWLSLMRSGQRPAPRLDVVTTLAAIFGVPAAYFHDDRAGFELARLLPVLLASNSDETIRRIMERLPSAAPDQAAEALSALRAD